MKLKFQGSQKRPIRVTISQKGLGKKFQKIHLFDNQYPKVNGIVTLFTVTNFRPVSTSSTYVINLQQENLPREACTSMMISYSTESKGEQEQKF